MMTLPSPKESCHLGRYQMARNITISLLGPEPYRLPYQDDLNSLVTAMEKHWAQELSKVLCDSPDLIVVPEACDRYPNFTVQERLRYYEARQNRIRDFFAEVCLKNYCNIAYSAARCLPDGSYRNSIQLLDRHGKTTGIYNKNHLVVTEVSEGGMLCGKNAPIFHLDFGNVCCAICFDLNFEELRQKYEKLNPDLILFSSMYHGGLVQNEWAYHCRSYFAGAVAGLPCTVINPLGEIVAHSTNYHHYITAHINLDYQMLHLDFNSEKIQTAKKKYGSLIEIRDPGFMGAVMLTSESEEFSAKDIIQEFHMEPLDDYFTRSRKCRFENME